MKSRCKGDGVDGERACVCWVSACACCTMSIEHCIALALVVHERCDTLTALGALINDNELASVFVITHVMQLLAFLNDNSRRPGGECRKKQHFRMIYDLKLMLVITNLVRYMNLCLSCRCYPSGGTIGFEREALGSNLGFRPRHWILCGHDGCKLSWSNRAADREYDNSLMH